MRRQQAARVSALESALSVACAPPLAAGAPQLHQLTLARVLPRHRLPSTHRDVASFEGFCCPWQKQLLFVVAGLCTGGLLWLLAKWSLRVRTLLRLRRCPLRDAQYVRTTVRRATAPCFRRSLTQQPQRHGCSNSRGLAWQCMCTRVPALTP